MLTIQQALQLATSLVDSPTPRLDTEVLLMAVLGRNRSFLYGWPEYRLTEAEARRFQKLMARRQRGHPLAFLTGEREFWSLSLQVNQHVLIPRQETELVVETALECLKDSYSARVGDLGTGSGAIALALAAERPGWQITGIERSFDALAVAAANRDRLGFRQVRLIQGHWADALARHSMDLIVANPPYIDPEDIHLQQGDLRFEPRQALVADEGGLACFPIIIQQACEVLSPGGWLILEHGYDQAVPIADLLVQAGFTGVVCHDDLAGQPRVSVGRLPIPNSMDNQDRGSRGAGCCAE